MGEGRRRRNARGWHAIARNVRAFLSRSPNGDLNRQLKSTDKEGERERERERERKGGREGGRSGVIPGVDSRT